MGNEAIERDSYVFKPGNKPSAVFCPPADSLPPDILSLFNRTFIDGRNDPSIRASAADWYITLNRYLTNELAQCRSNEKHQYYKYLESCPYCAADERHLKEHGGMVEDEAEKDLTDKHYSADDVVSTVKHSKSGGVSTGSAGGNNSYGGYSGTAASSRAIAISILIFMIAIGAIFMMFNPGGCSSDTNPQPPPVVSQPSPEQGDSLEPITPHHSTQGTRYDLAVSETNKLVVYVREDLFEFVESDIGWHFIYTGIGYAVLGISIKPISPQGYATQLEFLLNQVSGGNNAEYVGEEPIRGSTLSGYYASIQHDGEVLEAWVHILKDSDVPLLFFVRYENNQQKEALNEILSSLDIE
jgi:glutaredoxin